jgi:hypothetical protein
MTPSKSIFALSILAALTTSLPARADIPPDDACVAAMVGEPCSNASGSSQPGICAEATCRRATPDGAMTYTCYRCQPSEMGAGGHANEAGAAGQASHGGSFAGTAPSDPRGGAGAGATGGARAKSGTSGGLEDPNSEAADEGGCSMVQARGGAGALGLALAALGFAVAGWRRRRSLWS